MSRQAILPYFVVCAMLFVSAAFAKQVFVAAGVRVRTLGVDQYAIAGDMSSRSLQLFNNGKNVGAASYVIDPSGEQRMVLTHNAVTVSAMWHPAKKELQMSFDGQNYVFHFDSATKSWDVSPAAREILNSYTGEIELLSYIFDDLRQPAIQHSAHSTHKVHTNAVVDCDPNVDPTCDCDPDIDPTCGSDPIGGGGTIGGGDPTTPTWSCTGPWITADSGFGLYNKSQACYVATDNVNNSCSNQYCWGCCQVLACDATCLTGDLLCYAMVSGERCGPGY